MKALRHVLLLGALAVIGQGASVTYTINFTGGSPNPTSGSFTYDISAGAFTAFNVVWNGQTFNFLPSVNRPVSQNGCPLTNGAGIFAILVNGGTCNGLSLGRRWQVFAPNPPGNLFASSLNFTLFNSSNQGYVVGGLDADPSFVATPTSGTFTVTLLGTTSVLFSNTSATVPPGSGLVQGVSHGLYLTNAFQFSPLVSGTFADASIDLWTNSTDGAVTAFLYSDAGNTPGAILAQLNTTSAPFFSTLPLLSFGSNHTTFVQTSGPAVNLAAGSKYWFALAPADANSLLFFAIGGSTLNVSESQRFAPSGPWNITVPNQNIQFEIRGTPAPSTAFPTGSFIRTTFEAKFDPTFDEIRGGIGLPQAFDGFYSTDGIDAAKAYASSVIINGNTVTNSGPAAGAWSDCNAGSGFGRGVAFSTFTNIGASTGTYKVNAALSGSFDQGPFGLPPGVLQAGGAVHVFDSEKFNALIAAGIDTSHGLTTDQAVGQYLLAGPSLLGGTDPQADFSDITNRLAAALIADTQMIYSQGPFGPVSTTLQTPAFNVASGKSFTVMFDIVASARGGSNRSGSVNFIDTLKPAETFIADSSGNPATGLAVMGELPSLPLSPASISVVPPSGQLLNADPYTVTALVTDSTGNPNAGAVVKFEIASGPDAGVSGVGIADATGAATFSYFGRGGPGTDTITARTGNLTSNSVLATWQAPNVVCTGCYFTSQGLRATLAFNAGNPGGSNVFTYNYRSAAQTVQFTSAGVLENSVAGNVVTLSGPGSLNGKSGYTFTATATDGGAAGSGLDSVSISITGPDNYSYSASGAIAGGDILIKAEKWVR